MRKQSESEGLFLSSGFDGPAQSRHCTDVLFLILFVMAFISMNAIGFASLGIVNSPIIQPGSPLRLLRGVDYMGEICGIDPSVTSLNNKWEPNAFGTNIDSDGNYVAPGVGICVTSCPNAGESRSDPYGKYGSWIAPIDTINVLGYCIPFDSPRIENFADTMFGDFIRAAKVISTLGFVVAIVASILFLLTIRIPGVLRSVVWLSITIIFLVFACGAYLLLEKVKADQKLTGASAPSTQQILLEKGLGAALAVCAILWLSIICYLRERIALSISLVRESVKALLAMPLLIFFPLFQSVAFGVFSVLWLTYSIYLVSSGDVTTTVDSLTGDSYKVISYDQNSKHAIVFMVFCWLWNVWFLEAFGQLLSAHAVLTWYFAPNRKLITSSQVFTSASICLRFHCGTAAFGSLILALFQMMKMLIEYIKMKLLPRKSCLTRIITCALSCILCVFESCLKFMSEQAYIQCALLGTSFCPSAARAFGLIARNIGRVTTVTSVAVFVMMAGKLSIALTAAGIAYLYMSTYMKNDLSGVVLPTVLVGYLAYRVSSLFLSVVSITSNTILQAYIAEEEMNLSNPGRAKGEDGAEWRALVTDLKEVSMDVDDENWHVQHGNDSDIEMVQSPVSNQVAVQDVDVEANADYDHSPMFADDLTPPATTASSEGGWKEVSHKVSAHYSNNKGPAKKPPKPAAKVTPRPEFDTSTATTLKPNRGWSWGSNPAPAPSTSAAPSTAKPPKPLRAASSTASRPADTHTHSSSVRAPSPTPTPTRASQPGGPSTTKAPRKFGDW